HTHTICMAAPLAGQREAEERHPMYAVTKRGDLPPRYLLRPRLLSLLAAHRRLRVVCSATRAMRVKPLAALGRGALALTVGVAALANLASLLVAHPLARAITFERMTGLSIWWLDRTGTLVAVVLLLLVSHALLRGKRQAWQLALGLSAITLLGALLNHRQWSSTAAILALLVLLLAFAPLFPTRSDRWAVLKGYGAIALSLGLTTSYALLNRLVVAGTPRTALVLRHAIHLGLRPVALLALAYGVYALLRPVPTARRLRAGEHLLAAGVVAEHGT